MLVTHLLYYYYHSVSACRLVLKLYILGSLALASPPQPHQIKSCEMIIPLPVSRHQMLFIWRPKIFVFVSFTIAACRLVGCRHSYGVCACRAHALVLLLWCDEQRERKKFTALRTGTINLNLSRSLSLCLSVVHKMIPHTCTWTYNNNNDVTSNSAKHIVITNDKNV